MTTSLLLKSFIRTFFRACGVDLIRASENTSETWLSLRSIPFECVIDVGANEGQFARVAVSSFPGARIFCFEPLLTSFEILKAFAEKTHPDRLYCFNCAIGSSNGELEFDTHVDHLSSSSFLKATDTAKTYCPALTRTAKQIVEVKRLDEVMPIAALANRPVLLKLDVQGFEDRVLLGATETLKRVDAAIIEVNFAKMYEDQAKFIDIVTLLDTAGLTYTGNINQIYAPNGSVLWTDCVFTREG